MDSQLPAKPTPEGVQSQPVQSSMVTGQGKKMFGWELDEGLPMVQKWEFLVRLQGKQKDKAKQYIADRDGTKCCFCGIEEQNLNALTIHHRDGIESHNHRSNLLLAHLGHNTSWYHRKKVQSSVPNVREREAESILPKPGIVAAVGGAFDFRPGMSRSEMALEMRAEWDHWIDGIVLGERDMDRSPLRGGKVLMLRDLAQMAHHALHCQGSWKTYYDYAMEDRFGGCLVVWKSTGKQWVAHRDFYELVTINGVKVGTFHGEEDLTVIPKQVPIERTKEEGKV